MASLHMSLHKKCVRWQEKNYKAGYSFKNYIHTPTHTYFDKPPTFCYSYVIANRWKKKVELRNGGSFFF